MNLDMLNAIIWQAQNKAHKNGSEPERICVVLNRKAFIDIETELRNSMLFLEYAHENRNILWILGAQVSWSPLFDKFPNGHAVGIYWGGTE
jgi:hypothetical protein